jgi:hypothetical protein
MKARTARRVAIPVALVIALALAFAAWMFWITRSAKTSWVVPAAYTVSADGSTLTLYDWGGACDKPLSAQVLGQSPAMVEVAMLRTVPAGSCSAMAVLHQVDVALSKPLGDRRVSDRSGATVPAAASAADVLAHPSQFGFGSG